MPTYDIGRIEMVPNTFDGHGSDGSTPTGTDRSGKHRYARNECLDSSDTHYPKSSER